jgi:hypothetical protein
VPAARIHQTLFVSAAFARAAVQPMLAFRAPFAELQVAPDAQGRVRRMTLVFDSMDASLSRTDLSYGGSTQDEHGRRVPLDEFTAAATLFLAHGLGVEPERARRLLKFLMTKECGLGPIAVAQARVGWVVDESAGGRRYGLFVEAERPQA